MIRLLTALTLVLGACFSKPSPPTSAPLDGSDGGPTLTAGHLAAGRHHACWIDGSKQLFCWGDNRALQLGDPDTTPGRIHTLGTDWTSIAAGGAHSCGIQAGMIKCWGRNGAMQVAAKTSTVSDLPPTIVTLPATAGAPVNVYAGGDASCAIDTAGALYCWGDIEPAAASTPPSGVTLVKPGQDAGPWSSVAISQTHVCALHAGGGVWCWGVADDLQLGTPDVTPLKSVQAFQVPGTFAVLATNYLRSCAITTAGELGCWGDPSAVMKLVPATYTTIAAPTWSRVAIGGDHVCAIQAGKLYCYGYEENGALGIGGFKFDANNLTIAAIADVTEVVAGDGFTCTADAQQHVRCWGSNHYGEVGAGPPATETTKFMVPLPGPIASLVTGDHHTCAVEEATRDVYCWGDNEDGQVRPAATTPYLPSPLKAQATKVSQLAAGASHTCGIDATDATNLACWGRDIEGQIGTDNHGTSPWSQLAAGGNTTCATSNGSVACWGNLFELGPRSPKTLINGLVSPALHRDFAIALEPGSKALYQWGATPWRGHCTDTAAIGMPLARTVVMAGMVQTAASHGGEGHACVLDGATLFCWGHNSNHQANPTADACANATMIPGSWASASAGAATTVAAGASHTCAVRAAGDLWCWGDDNTDATMGIIGEGGSTAPALARTGPFTSVAMGEHHTCALGSDKHVYCWGLNKYGEVGNGRRFLDVPPADPIAFP